MGPISSTPLSASIASTFLSGRGVILSIMLHGKETVSSSFTYPTNSSVTNPFFCHSSAIVTMLAFSFSPLWLQLSMLTTASGSFPALKRSRSMAQTTLMACLACAGPSSISAATTFIKFPERS